jgi:hypothetical protein
VKQFGVGLLLVLVDGAALLLLGSNGLYVAVATGGLVGYVWLALEPVRKLASDAEATPTTSTRQQG